MNEKKYNFIKSLANKLVGSPKKKPERVVNGLNMIHPEGIVT